MRVARHRHADALDPARAAAEDELPGLDVAFQPRCAGLQDDDPVPRRPAHTPRHQDLQQAESVRLGVVVVEATDEHGVQQRHETLDLQEVRRDVADMSSDSPTRRCPSPVATRVQLRAVTETGRSTFRSRRRGGRCQQGYHRPAGPGRRRHDVGLPRHQPLAVASAIVREPGPAGPPARSRFCSIALVQRSGSLGRAQTSRLDRDGRGADEARGSGRPGGLLGVVAVGVRPEGGWFVFSMVFIVDSRGPGRAVLGAPISE